jgi:citrate synthase
MRAPKGLEGVILCDTRISDVDGAAGTYRYRDYDATELARKRSLEDVWCLLIDGELPTGRQRDAFVGEVQALRELPREFVGRVDCVRAPATPDRMAAMRSACSLLAEVLGWRPMLDVEPYVVRTQALQLSAVLPTIVAAMHRRSERLPFVPPAPDLGIAANYLYMLRGERPRAEHARALEQYMISAADHGMGAGTFVARVTASTGADLGAAAVGAIGALSGPLHGGAPTRALEMLDEIGSADQADKWLRERLQKGERIMGFGHRVYRAPDPRALLLREIAHELGGERVALAEHVEARAAALLAEEKPDHVLPVNVEFYAAVVMEQVGVPRELLPCTFGLARMPGWSAHILEQMQDNRLIRPLTEFAGGPLRSVPELD